MGESATGHSFLIQIFDSVVAVSKMECCLVAVRERDCDVGGWRAGEPTQFFGDGLFCHLVILALTATVMHSGQNGTRNRTYFEVAK